MCFRFYNCKSFQVNIKFQNHDQLVPPDLGIRLPVLEIGKLKRALLQPLTPNHKARAIPDQELDPVAPAVDENENVAREEVAAHLSGNQPAKAVKSLAHVGRAAKQKIPLRRSEPDHDRSNIIYDCKSPAQMPSGNRRNAPLPR